MNLTTVKPCLSLLSVADIKLYTYTLKAKTGAFAHGHTRRVCRYELASGKKMNFV